MTKTLTKYVNVNGTMYAPGDKLPKEVADQITNPKAFEDDGAETPADEAVEAEQAADEAATSGKAPAKKAAAKP